MKEIVSTRYEWENIGDQLNKGKDIIQLLTRTEKILNQTIRTLNECEDLSNSAIIKLDLDQLEEQRGQLLRFSRDIHRHLLYEVDTPFYRNTMRILHRLYRLNPSEIQCKDQTMPLETNISLSILANSLLIDQELKEDYRQKMKDLDEDIPNETLKNMMIDSIKKYFDEKTPTHMISQVGSIENSEINISREMMIEYYELLHPENASKINKLLEGMNETKFSYYQEDIENIKFIAYTAREPYHTVFFEYISKLSVEDYNVEVLDEQTGEMKPETQYFMPSTNALYLNFNRKEGKGQSDVRGAYFTFFHEVGHGIDDVGRPEEGRFFGIKYRNDAMYRLEYKDGDGETLYDVAKRDVEHNLEKTIYEVGNSMNVTVSNEDIEYLKDVFIRKDTIQIKNYTLRRLYAKTNEKYKQKLKGNVTSSVSDIYGGITNNKIKGEWGHWGEDYWYDKEGNPTGLQSAELFAHLFATSMINKKEKEEVTKEYFPEAYIYFEEMIKWLKIK